jgi:hypothetical protein
MRGTTSLIPLEWAKCVSKFAKTEADQFGRISMTSDGHKVVLWVTNLPSL